MNNYLLDEWPEISFDLIENIEIENKGVRIFYQSFFKLMHFPENAVKAVYLMLTYDSPSEGGNHASN